MANFDDLMTIAKNSGFQDRVKYALESASINVLAESTGTANHGARRAYAVKVLNGGSNISNVAISVLTNSTIAAEAVVATTPDYAIPDSDIQFTVNSLFDALSAV